MGGEEVKKMSKDNLYYCGRIMFLRDIIDFPDGTYSKIKIGMSHDFAMREDSPYFFYHKRT